MPCMDVTEIVEIWLDAEERLMRYALHKQTCGRSVGEPSLLQAHLAGRTLEDILGMRPDAYIEAHSPCSPLEEFLVQKHFAAVQSALRVYMGREPGGPDDPCLAASIALEGDATRIEGHISIQITPGHIQPCGPCPRCD